LLRLIATPFSRGTGPSRANASVVVLLSDGAQAGRPARKDLTAMDARSTFTPLTIRARPGRLLALEFG